MLEPIRRKFVFLFFWFFWGGLRHHTDIYHSSYVYKHDQQSIADHISLYIYPLTLNNFNSVLIVYDAA